MSDGKRVVPREIAELIWRQIPTRVLAGVAELAADLAPLARRDPEAFDREWCAGVERIVAAALELTREDIASWAAPEAQWHTEQ